MRSCSLVCSVAALLAVGLAFPTAGRHEDAVVHESRSTLPAGWTRAERANPDGVLPLRIGLKQQNLHRADEFLDAVSSPTSSRYGQHWTAQEVADMFAPADASISAVTEWLADSGIDPSRVAVSPSRLWVTLNATVAEAEALLKTTYHIYDHENSGQAHVACESYSVPAYLGADHIDLIMPTLHFDTKLRRGGGGGGSGSSLRRRQYTPKQPGLAKGIGSPKSGSLPKLGQHLSAQNIITELMHCDTQIVPDCLRALYSFGPGISAEPGNTYGIVEYTPQSYRPGDLDLFFSNFSRHQVGSRPKLAAIDGGVLQQTNASFDFNGESDLDLQYAMALVYPQKVLLYQVGDLVEGASFNNFLDAIDASYCTSGGGDDPTQDGIYPDPMPGGYQGKEDCGSFAATNVISTSYAYNEADLTPAYETRQCNEYLKLGLQGVTVLYSSGDDGVAGNSGQCIAANGTYNDGSSGRFNPSFPGTCPYITSVGATQVPTGTNILVDLATGTQPETACETVIWSGGGFSNVFAMPSYQATAVKHFLSAYPPPYGADRYNNSGLVRAFPDVSANGANYVVAVDDQFSMVYGTSASSPTFGSVVTLINELRLAVGKGPVGFINPALYAHAYVMNDVTKGGNKGCGTPGFQSAPGWDPVTGLGTPNYVKMAALFLSLP